MSRRTFLSIRINKGKIGKTFQDRIEKEFGRQVLDDIFDIGDSLFIMSDLDEGADPSWHLSILFDTKRQERLKTLYNVDFEVVGDDVWIREAEKHQAEMEWLHERKNGVHGRVGKTSRATASRSPCIQSTNKFGRL